ncbi:E7 [Pygoscelis adeliae papillomavirus 2]|uniref:E7 n=1 Tax=Pygoscelis adeliae papillomavirus 2 TaxID=2045113 RepID=A0A291PWK8_9PAPI|nr:E7 [Pygoscelis adeliae papillomavirus 2]
MFERDPTDMRPAHLGDTNITTYEELLIDLMYPTDEDVESQSESDSDIEGLTYDCTTSELYCTETIDSESEDGNAVDGQVSIPAPSGPPESLSLEQLSVEEFLEEAIDGFYPTPTGWTCHYCDSELSPVEVAAHGPTDPWNRTGLCNMCYCSGLDDLFSTEE